LQPFPLDPLACSRHPRSRSFRPKKIWFNTFLFWQYANVEMLTYKFAFLTASHESLSAQTFELINGCEVLKSNFFYQGCKREKFLGKKRFDQNSSLNYIFQNLSSTYGTFFHNLPSSYDFDLTSIAKFFEIARFYRHLISFSPISQVLIKTFYEKNLWVITTYCHFLTRVSENVVAQEWIAWYLKLKVISHGKVERVSEKKVMAIMNSRKHEKKCSRMKNVARFVKVASPSV